MDHSFNDRVDKVFGSIPSSSSSAPWSVTDAQVERKVWKRDKAENKEDDETLVSSSFDNLFSARRNRRNSLHDLSDDDKEDVGGDDGVQTENDGDGDADADVDEWDIRSSIGLDSTLDNEEEEDAYDKMAEGRENGGERLYMKDVTDHGPYLNSLNVLPSSVHGVRKDPHANHDAAKTRLKEDNGDDDDEPMLNAEEACMTVAASEDGSGMKIKSILKRKNDDDDDAVKPAKRVRFDQNCKNDDELRNIIQPQGFGRPGNGPSVPDYVLNPSKYTRYDFDDLSHEEGSNHEAYLDFMGEIKNSKCGGVEEKSCGDLAGSSVVFIPRKKRGDDGEAAAFNREEQFKQLSTKGIAIAASEVQQQEEEEEEEEDGKISQERQESHVCSKKPGRRYRSRMEEEEEDDPAS